MRKIPTLFRRDPDDMRRVLPEVTPGCEWVLAGEGVATRKYDGTCVMLDESGNWWARREVKRDRPRPAGFIAVEADSNTGKTVGWEPITQSPFAKFHAEALAEDVSIGREFEPGTYELCGPKVQANPEGYERHRLVKHSAAETFGTTSVPRVSTTCTTSLLPLVARTAGRALSGTTRTDAWRSSSVATSQGTTNSPHRRSDGGS